MPGNTGFFVHLRPSIVIQPNTGSEVQSLFSNDRMSPDACMVPSFSDPAILIMLIQVADG